MNRRRCPQLTELQLRLLAAISIGSAVGSRTSTIAVRSGIPAQQCYPMLARLQRRKFVRRASFNCLFYVLTDEGSRELAATEAYRAARGEKP